jgi:hypothetical protein
MTIELAAYRTGLFGRIKEPFITVEANTEKECISLIVEHFKGEFKPTTWHTIRVAIYPIIERTYNFVSINPSMIRMRPPLVQIPEGFL